MGLAPNTCGSEVPSDCFAAVSSRGRKQDGSKSGSGRLWTRCDRRRHVESCAQFSLQRPVANHKSSLYHHHAADTAQAAKGHSRE